MLRAMILIVLGIVLLITILTQIILPMFTDKLAFFWYFKKGSRDDIISIDIDEPDKNSLTAKALEAKKNYKSMKQEIQKRKDKLEQLDKDTDV